MLQEEKSQEAIAVWPKTWVNFKARALTETAIATAIAVIVPALLAHTPQNQFIVGPIVNAVLFWVALRVGIVNAIFIAVVPSSIALLRGMLPPQAILAIPYIIAGNIAMIMTFSALAGQFKKSVFLYFGVVASALVKTAVIFLPVLYLLKLTGVIAFMLSWPQLVTAVIGGFIVIKTQKYFQK